MSEIIVGIDLGTTNSEIAVVQNGCAIIIEAAGRKVLPSFVGMDEQGEVLVGEPAKNQYVLYPERTVKSIKRKMGQDIKVEMAGQTYTPQEISAIILRQLKSIAEHYLHQAVNKAVITVPAYFSDAQRQATREAGEIAGLEVVRMINEPTAAALSYEVTQNSHKHLLVYDLGGGTFDVSVVSIQSNVVEVLASYGNNHLGGDDFDQKIIDHFIQHLHTTQNIDIRSSRRAMARLTRAAEVAKIALSDQPFVAIEEEYLEERLSIPIHLSLELSRETYEAMITEYIEETLKAVHQTLKEAHLTPTEIDEILLVGGSTRTPLVMQRLEEEFHQRPHGEVNPELCVASGAAIQAALIAGQEVQASAVLVDITPYTYGTSALGDLEGELYPYRYIPMIRKNSPLPLTKTEVFYTTFDQQEAVDIHIYQGEDPDALNNIQIGEFVIEGLSPVPLGNPILLRLALDLDGILHVSAQEKNTGLEKSISINNAISRFEESEMALARERIRKIFSEPEQADALTIQAQNLVGQARGRLETASEEDKEDLVGMIEAIHDALAQQNTQALQEACKQLSDILYYLDS